MDIIQGMKLKISEFALRGFNKTRLNWCSVRNWKFPHMKSTADIYRNFRSAKIATGIMFISLMSPELFLFRFGSFG